MKIPGEHNVSNALAALNTARILGISDKISLEALSEFQGSWRRFEEKKIINNHLSFIIISDYGHHPTEILATMKAAREKYKNEKIWLIFQPHQYQRVFFLFNDFVKVFQEISDKKLADKLIITDIFDVAGRENQDIKKKISAEKLARKTKRENITYLAKDKLAKRLKNNLETGDIALIMGAGDIYKLGEELSTE